MGGASAPAALLGEFEPLVDQLPVVPGLVLEQAGEATHFLARQLVEVM